MPARPVKLPALLRLAGWDWRVRRAKMADGAYGEADPVTRVMTISPKQPRLDELDTVLHETFHAVLRSQGRPYDPGPEELYVQALATGLVGALRDNPDLLRYLNESLT